MHIRLQTIVMSLGSLGLAGLFIAGLGMVLAMPTSDFELMRLTTSPSFDRTSSNPSFSADGTKIVFDSNADLLNQCFSLAISIPLIRAIRFMNMTSGYMT
jgi:hypothetical protein